MLWLAEGPSLPQAPSSRQGSQETEELRHAKTRDIAEQIIVRRLHLLRQFDRNGTVRQASWIILDGSKHNEH
jgi:hypothetical protein